MDGTGQHSSKIKWDWYLNRSSPPYQWPCALMETTVDAIQKTFIFRLALLKGMLLFSVQAGKIYPILTVHEMTLWFFRLLQLRRKLSNMQWPLACRATTPSFSMMERYGQNNYGNNTETSSNKKPNFIYISRSILWIPPLTRSLVGQKWTQKPRSSFLRNLRRDSSWRRPPWGVRRLACSSADINSAEFIRETLRHENWCWKLLKKQKEDSCRIHDDTIVKHPQ